MVVVAPQLKLTDDRLTVTGEKGYSMIRATHGMCYVTLFSNHHLCFHVCFSWRSWVSWLASGLFLSLSQKRNTSSPKVLLWNLWDKWHKVFTGRMPFSAFSQQCQRIEGNSDHWLQLQTGFVLSHFTTGLMLLPLHWLSNASTNALFTQSLVDFHVVIHSGILFCCT